MQYDKHLLLSALGDDSEINVPGVSRHMIGKLEQGSAYEIIPIVLPRQKIMNEAHPFNKLKPIHLQQVLDPLLLAKLLSAPGTQTTDPLEEEFKVIRPVDHRESEYYEGVLQAGISIQHSPPSGRKSPLSPPPPSVQSPPPPSVRRNPDRRRRGMNTKWDDYQLGFSTTAGVVGGAEGGFSVVQGEGTDVGGTGVKLTGARSKFGLEPLPFLSTHRTTTPLSVTSSGIKVTKILRPGNPIGGPISVVGSDISTTFVGNSAFPGLILGNRGMIQGDESGDDFIFSSRHEISEHIRQFRNRFDMDEILVLIKAS